MTFIPPALVLGCNTSHGIGVLSDWIEEQIGHAPDFSQSKWSDDLGDSTGNGYSSSLAFTSTGAGNGIGYGCGFAYSDGSGSGYGYTLGNGTGCGYGLFDGDGYGDGRVFRSQNHS